MFQDIEVAIDGRTQQILSSDSENFATTYTLLRSYLCRRKHLVDEDFTKIIETIFVAKFHKVPLSFTVIRQICVALKSLRPA
jgi:hypothetical protein